MNVLREYHAALGELIFRYEGTLDRYAGEAEVSWWRQFRRNRAKGCAGLVYLAAVLVLVPSMVSIPRRLRRGR